MHAIILAGGFGTRLRPLTDTTPKPLLPIKGKPIIQHIIENLGKHGISDIILSLGYKAEKIKEYFGDGSWLGARIRYSVEKEPLGTGGAIKLASRGIEGPFIVFNGDNLADFDITDILAFHLKSKAQITLALYPVADVTKWGIVELSGTKIIRFIEKPQVHEAPSNLNNAGCYCLEPGVLDMLPDGHSSIEKQCFEKLCGKEGKVFGCIHKGQWFPTDDMEKYRTADRDFIPLSQIRSVL